MKIQKLRRGYNGCSNSKNNNAPMNDKWRFYEKGKTLLNRLNHWAIGGFIN